MFKEVVLTFDKVDRKPILNYVLMFNSVDFVSRNVTGVVDNIGFESSDDLKDAIFKTLPHFVKDHWHSLEVCTSSRGSYGGGFVMLHIIREEI